jgi:hypothetical protein
VLFARPYQPPGATSVATVPADRMTSMITGIWATHVVRAAALHGLADIAARGDVTATDVARTAGLDPDATTRFLRAAATLGLLETAPATEDGDTYRGTDLLDTLRRDRPDSLHDLAVFMGQEMMALPWGALPEVLSTGTDQVERVLGAPFFDHAAAHPDQAEMFMAGMTACTWGTAEAIAEGLEPGDATTVVDVGGSDGGLLCAVLRAHPGLRGVLLELPHVVAGAVAAITTAGFADRVEVIGGDFFESVPEADVALLKFIVHDWPDDRAVAVLSRAREAVAGRGGRVVVLEQVLDGAGGIGPMADVNMMVLTPGRERTRAEFEALFAQAGLALERVLDTGTAIRMLEARPVGS